MKPSFKKLHFYENFYVIIHETTEEELDSRPHYHPEYELVYILAYTGAIDDRDLNSACIKLVLSASRFLVEFN